MKPHSKSDSSDVILVLTNLPDPASAETLAKTLVSGKLAACINLMSPCTSIYHWEGKIESSTEIPLLIKTTVAHYADVEATILNQHPYELPEILRVTVDGGLDVYLQWVASITNQGLPLE